MNQYSSFESMTQTQLMNCINEISFALDDLLLYLDTHPYDCNALQYVNQFIPSAQYRCRYLFQKICSAHHRSRRSRSGWCLELDSSAMAMGNHGKRMDVVHVEL